MLPGLRYANIALGVFLLIMVPGILLLKDAGDGPLQALVIGAFVVMLNVYVFLDERARRRSERDQ